MAQDSKKPLIIVVGNCVSGKSTLANNLQSLGYNARAILQEHAISPQMWRRSNPDILIFLSSSLEVARQRRSFGWGQERLDRQAVLLADARAAADLYIDTDNLNVEEVTQTAVEFLNSWQAVSKKIRKDNK